MKHLTPLLVLVFSLVISSTSLAQSGGSFDIDRSTVSDAGGGLSTGPDFELHGTIGQTDAGFHSGGDFTVTGGFWVNAETNVLFKDGYE